MVKKVLYEVFYLFMFERAMKKMNYDDAVKYLSKHKAQSDEVELSMDNKLADIKADVKEKQKLLESIVNDI